MNEQIIKNIYSRYQWVKERVYWTESDKEREDLERELEILIIFIGAMEWEI